MVYTILILNEHVYVCTISIRFSDYILFIECCVLLIEIKKVCITSLMAYYPFHSSTHMTQFFILIFGCPFHALFVTFIQENNAPTWLTMVEKSNISLVILVIKLLNSFTIILKISTNKNISSKVNFGY